jgi:hypothetical protein
MPLHKETLVALYDMARMNVVEVTARMLEIVVTYFVAPVPTMNRV